MNRRTFITTIAVAGSASLAGCKKSLLGTEGNEAVATAHSELSEAAAVLNSIELTIDGEVDISSNDFEGYSPGDVTQHTEIANEALSDDDSDASEVLLAVSTVLEETAYQYASIDDIFGYFATYRQQYFQHEYGHALEAGNRFGESLSEVASRSEKISGELARLDEAGYEEPVEGFSVQGWIDEQEIFANMMQAMNPLGVGLTQHASSMVLLGSIMNHQENGDYQAGIEEARMAKDGFETAKEKFRISLDRGLPQRRTTTERLACIADGHIKSVETAIEAFEAYENGNQSKGDDLWEQAGTESRQANEECASSE